MLRLNGLIPELRTAFNEGKFKDSTAFKIIILSAADQQKLLPVLAKNGWLINKDVDILLAATIQPKTPKAAPAPTPVAPPVPTVAAPAVDDDDRPWYEQCLDLVKQIQALAPIDEKDIHKIAEDLLKFVESAGAQATVAP